MEVQFKKNKKIWNFVLYIINMEESFNKTLARIITLMWLIGQVSTLGARDLNGYSICYVHH